MKVFIFLSTRAVIKAEEAARRAELPVRVIPVPRSISPHCGMALECGEGEARALRELITEKGIDFSVHKQDELSL